MTTQTLTLTDAEREAFAVACDTDHGFDVDAGLDGVCDAAELILRRRLDAVLAVAERFEVESSGPQPWVHCVDAAAAIRAATGPSGRPTDV